MRSALALAAVLFVRAAVGNPQPIAAYDAKAEFLFSFAKFVQWPIDAMTTTQRVTLCVVGDPAVADALARLVKGKNIEGHGIDAQLMKPDGPLSSCHVLYLGTRDGDASAAVLAMVKSAPVFTVGDCDGFTESGGIAQLVNEDGRMRFVINLIAAHQARLAISSKLLGLAKSVKG